MFIVLVILPVVKFKTLIISLLSFFFFDDNIPVSFIGIYAVSKPAITSWKDNKSVGYLGLIFDILLLYICTHWIFVYLKAELIFEINKGSIWNEQTFCFMLSPQ